MASLKDTVVSGSLRATDTIYSTTNQFQILRIPTSSNGTTYGPGTNGQILKSNGTSVYWASDNNSDTKVTQAAAITTAGAYPIILANSTATTAVTDTVNKTSTLTYNPNTKSLVTGGTVDGYTLAAASAKSVTDSSSASAIGTGTSLPTERDIYYGLPTINNAHNYTSSTSIYAPTGGGTEGQFLGANGSTSTPVWKDLHYTDIKPIVKKTYTSTDYYAAAANNENACFFFMSVKPDSWQKPWTVRFKVHTYCPNSTYINNQSITYSTYSGRADSYIFKNWNEAYTSAHYYTSILYLKKAGFDAGLEHAIGINLLYANNYTVAAAYRTFEIEYYECDGCTVTILDNPIKLINWPNYNTTNYNFANNDAVNRGLQESGDSSDVARLTIINPRITTGAVGIGRYTLFMRTSDGTYQSITSTFNNTGTSHVKNTALFRPERIFYRNAGSELAANNSTNNDNSWMDYTPGGLVDLRYSTNCGSTLQVRKPVYLVGTINDDGFFSLADTWYTQTEPTSDDGKVYIYLGMPYTQDNSSGASSQYRIAFEFNNPIYWYKDGAFRLYEPIPPVTRGGTGATSASGARTNLGVKALQSNINSPIANGNSISFIDTISQNTQGVISATKKTIPEVTQNEPGLMISSDKIKLDSIETKKQVKTVTVEPAQSGSGDPSPDNVRPISGWTGAVVTRTGKNLLRPLLTSPKTAYGLTLTPNDDGSITITGNPTNGSTAMILSREILQAGEYPLKGGTYIISRGDDNALIYIQAVPFSGTVMYARRIPVTYTYPNDISIRYLDIGINANDGSAINVTIYPQLELGSTATDYEPYQGEIYNITFPSTAGTVYGGTLDLIAGTLTVDTKAVTLTGTENIWSSTTNRFCVTYNDAIRVNTTNQLTEQSVISERFKSTTWGGLGGTNGNLCCAPVYGRGIAFRDDSITTVDAWKTYFTNNPTRFVYHLETPIVYNIDPTKILLLTDEDNIWSNTGNVILQSYFLNNATNIIGTIAIANGGTGATTAATARTNLGLGNLAVKNSLIASDIPDLSSTYLRLTGGTLSGTLNFKHSTMNTVKAESLITNTEYFSTKAYSVQDNDDYIELRLAPLLGESIHEAAKLAVSDGTNTAVTRIYHTGNIIYSATAPTDADVVGGLAEGMIWLQPV